MSERPFFPWTGGGAVSEPRVVDINGLLEAMADAIIDVQTQSATARKAGFSEKHVSQMLTGKVYGSLAAWGRMLDAAGLALSIVIVTAPPPIVGGGNVYWGGPAPRVMLPGDRYVDPATVDTTGVGA